MMVSLGMLQLHAYRELTKYNINITNQGGHMSVGQQVKFISSGKEVIRGVIIKLDPFKDGQHTQIFWADPQEENGWTVSIWENIDFEVIG